MTAPELQRIHSQAQANNRTRQLTGVLLYGGGWFMQLLEGDEVALARTFDRILHDRRHRDVHMLQQRRIERRLMPNWAMGMINLDFAGELEKNRFLCAVEAIRANAAEAGGSAAALLRAFRQQFYGESTGKAALARG